MAIARKSSAPRKARVTQETIARNLGVDRTTVSICLGNSPLARNMRQQTREMILAEAARLNYRPNFFATQLRRRQSNVILACAMRLQDYHSSLILEAFEAAAADRGYRVIVSCLANAHIPSEMVRDIIGPHGVSSLALITRAADWFPDRVLRSYLNEEVGIVLVGRQHADARIAQVYVDEEKCAELAVQHLTTRFGRRLCIVAAERREQEIEPGHPGMQLRVVRYQEQRIRILQGRLRQLGLPAARVLRVPRVEDDRRPGETARVVREVLAAGRLPGAFVCLSDVLAWGVLQGLAGTTVSAGRDVGVLGYDDIFPSMAMTPSLTAIHQPARRLGTIGAELLIAASSNDSGGPKSRMLAPRLTVRESTGGQARYPAGISR